MSVPERNKRSISTRFTPLEVRFWAKVERRTDCWLWTGSRMSSGYGRFRMPDGHTEGAHRIAYKLSGFAIPAELTLDHLCGVKLCVNPDHLEPVTRGENARRWASARTHCKNGHEFTPDNTRWDRPRWQNGEPTRACRACGRDRWRARHWEPEKEASL